MPLRWLRRFLALLLLPTVAGCAALGYPQDEIVDLSQLGADQVLVVGKVVVSPPLRETERDTTVPNDVFGVSKDIRNRAILSFAADPRTSVEKARYRINPELGRTYFFGLRRDVPFMVGGSIITSYSMVGGNLRASEIVIPGGLRVAIRPGDRAVYVGTIHLTRDEFNEVTAARIIDEYGQAASAVRQRFGTGLPLRRALFDKAG